MRPFLSSRMAEWSTSWVWSSPPDLGPRRPTVMACASQQGSDWLQPANRAELTAGQRSCRQREQGCPLSSRMPGSAPPSPMRCQWQPLPSQSQLQMLPDESWGGKLGSPGLEDGGFWNVPADGYPLCLGLKKLFSCQDKMRNMQAIGGT